MTRSKPSLEHSSEGIRRAPRRVAPLQGKHVKQTSFRTNLDFIQETNNRRKIVQHFQLCSILQNGRICQTILPLIATRNKPTSNRLSPNNLIRGRGNTEKSELVVPQIRKIYGMNHGQSPTLTFNTNRNVNSYPQICPTPKHPNDVNDQPQTLP